MYMASSSSRPAGRTLTSAWIETMYKTNNNLTLQVALSRVRGLKPREPKEGIDIRKSHSHECVD